MISDKGHRESENWPGEGNSSEARVENHTGGEPVVPEVDKEKKGSSRGLVQHGKESSTCP